MLIGQKLREIREAKNMRQLEISEATGLVQPYVSRVENGHTIPGVETLEKWASALKIPLYQILYDGEKPPKLPRLSGNNSRELWGSSGRDSHDLKRLRQFLAKMNEHERKLLMSLAGRLALHPRHRADEKEA
ncbi:MAG TPA: helix-turn-helix transcriptional regulator [Candidatus Acidoferrum sp.]